MMALKFDDAVEVASNTQLFSVFDQMIPLYKILGLKNVIARNLRRLKNTTSVKICFLFLTHVKFE